MKYTYVIFSTTKRSNGQIDKTNFLQVANMMRAVEIKDGLNKAYHDLDLDVTFDYDIIYTEN